MIYPLVNIQKAIENGPVEIVDLPSYKIVDLSSSLCRGLPEGTHRQKNTKNISLAGQYLSPSIASYSRNVSFVATKNREILAKNDHLPNEMQPPKKKWLGLFC